jgi:hypothetical protein
VKKVNGPEYFLNTLYVSMCVFVRAYVRTCVLACECVCMCVFVYVDMLQFLILALATIPWSKALKYFVLPIHPLNGTHAQSMS